jgi:hypothetical protein
MNINWVDDLAAMAIADSLGIGHVTQIISVDDIDRKRSAENRARDIPLDESRRDGITHSMDAGVPIPKIFVRNVGGSFVIAGGNHRFSGIRPAVKSIPVHATLCTDAEFELLCRALNTVVGVGMTQAERIRAAVDAIERLGMTQKDASGIYGVALSTVGSAYRKTIAERRAKAILPNAKCTMKQSHFNGLGDLIHNDNVLKAAAIFVDKAKADAKTLGEIASVAKTKKTEAEQVEVFTQATEPYRKGKKVSVPRRIRQSLLKTLDQIEKLEGKTTWQSLELDPIEVESVRRRMRKAASTLLCLCREDGCH